MPKHTRFTVPRLSKKSLRHLVMGLACSLVAFAVGLETAGDVHPFDTSEAAVAVSAPERQTAVIRGDIDADYALTVEDAILSLSFAEGLDQPSADDVRRGDMDGDFLLTTKDTLRMLHLLRL